MKKRERSGITTLNRHLLGSLIEQLRAKGQIMSCSVIVASPHEFKTRQQHVHSSAFSLAMLGAQPGTDAGLPWGSSAPGPTASIGLSSASRPVPSPYPPGPHFPDFLTLPAALMIWCTLQKMEALRSWQVGATPCSSREGMSCLHSVERVNAAGVEGASASPNSPGTV